MKYELRIMIFLVFAMILASLCIIHPVYAADLGPVPAGLTEIEQVFGNIISVVVGLGFIALLVMLLWAGFKYLTSGGEPKAIQSANLTATWAVLGLFFLAIAWLILQLIGSFTGLPVTTFNIKSLCVGPVSSMQFCTPP